MNAPKCLAFFGTPAPRKMTRAEVSARAYRAEVMNSGDAKRIASHLSACARNTAHMWAEIEAADEAEENGDE